MLLFSRLVYVGEIPTPTPTPTPTLTPTPTPTPTPGAATPTPTPTATPTPTPAPSCTNYDLYYNSVGDIWITWTWCAGAGGSYIEYGGTPDAYYSTVCAQNGSVTVTNGSANAGSSC